MDRPAYPGSVRVRSTHALTQWRTDKTRRVSVHCDRRPLVSRDLQRQVHGVKQIRDVSHHTDCILNPCTSDGTVVVLTPPMCLTIYTVISFSVSIKWLNKDNKSTINRYKRRCCTDVENDADLVRVAVVDQDTHRALDWVVVYRITQNAWQTERINN